MYGITDPPHPMVSASNLASKEMEIAFKLGNILGRTAWY